MNWVPIDKLQKVNTEDRPRKLTEPELSYVLDRIPLPTTPDPTTAKAVQAQLRQTMLEKLREIEICPSGLIELTNQMIKYFYKSEVESGTSVGLIASEAFGALFTQMTLNTFHSSGSANSVSGGIGQTQNLVYASREPKGTITFMMLRDPFQSNKEILDRFLPQVSTCYFGDLIQDYDVFEYNIHNPDSMQLIFNRFPWLEFGLRSQGRTLLLSSTNTQVSATGFVLKLNLARMLRHKIAIHQLSDILENGDVFEKQPVVRVRCVFSSLEEATIILFPYFPNEPRPHLGNETDFYRTSALPSLEKVRISGIPEFQDFTLENRNVVTIIKSETKLTKDHYLAPYLVADSDNYLITFDPQVIRQFGILPIHFSRLATLSGIPEANIKLYQDSCLINLPIGSAKPSELIGTKINQANEQYQKSLESSFAKFNSLDKYSVEHRSLARTLAREEIPPLVKFSQINYVVMLGDNVRDLFRLKGIDRDRTYSTNIHRNREMFGIGAAAHYYAKAFHKLISDSGGSIEPSNILILTDCVANSGDLVGVRFVGLVSRQTQSFISNSTMSRAVGVFSDAARTGSTETTNNASAAIALGVKFNNGSGYNNIIQIVMKDGKLEQMLGDSVFEAHLYDPETEALRAKFRSLIRPKVQLETRGPLPSGEGDLDYANIITAIAQGNIPEEISKKISLKSKGLIVHKPQERKVLGDGLALISGMISQLIRNEISSQNLNISEVKSYLEAPAIMARSSPAAVGQDRSRLIDFLRRR